MPYESDRSSGFGGRGDKKTRFYICTHKSAAKAQRIPDVRGVAQRWEVVADGLFYTFIQFLDAQGWKDASALIRAGRDVVGHYIRGFHASHHEEDEAGVEIEFLNALAAVKLRGERGCEGAAEHVQRVLTKLGLQESQAVQRRLSRAPKVSRAEADADVRRSATPVRPTVPEAVGASAPRKRAADDDLGDLL